MARLPFMTRTKVPSGQAPVGDSSRPHSTPAAAPKLLPSSKPDQTKVDRGKKRQVETEIVKETDLKRKKVIVGEGSHTDPVAAAFGGIASRYYTELDLNTRKGRNDEEEEHALKTAMGDVFFHGLRVLGRKNSTIREQDRTCKRLATEIGNLNLKISESAKAAAEEVRQLKEEAEKARAELAKEKADHGRIVQVLDGELSTAQGELAALKASFEKASGEQYEVGYLDYLRTFLAADPEYSWSKFPPSTPAFMERFKVENAATIKEARDALDVQFQEEAKKTDVGGTEEVANNSPSHQAAS